MLVAAGGRNIPAPMGEMIRRLGHPAAPVEAFAFLAVRGRAWLADLVPLDDGSCEAGLRWSGHDAVGGSGVQELCCGAGHIPTYGKPNFRIIGAEVVSMARFVSLQDRATSIFGCFA